MIQQPQQNPHQHKHQSHPSPPSHNLLSPVDPLQAPVPGENTSRPSPLLSAASPQSRSLTQQQAQQQQQHILLNIMQTLGLQHKNLAQLSESEKTQVAAKYQQMVNKLYQNDVKRQQQQQLAQLQGMGVGVSQLNMSMSGVQNLSGNANQQLRAGIMVCSFYFP